MLPQLRILHRAGIFPNFQTPLAQRQNSSRHPPTSTEPAARIAAPRAPALVPHTAVPLEGAFHLSCRQQSQSTAELGLSLTGSDHWGNRVALTFDDGPNAQTPEVLRILKERGLSATFFVTGRSALEHPELIRHIVAQGHTLGNHTFSHPTLKRLSARAIRRQLQRTQEAVDAALGCHYPMTQVRPPFGATNGRVRRVFKELGLSMVLWNVDSNDWRYRNNDDAIEDNVFEGRYRVQRHGGVLLFHDIHTQTSRVLPSILDRLESGGFEVITTGDMLREKETRESRAEACDDQPPIRCEAKRLRGASWVRSKR